MRDTLRGLGLKLAVVIATTFAVTAFATPGHASKIGDGYIHYDCGSKYIGSVSPTV